MGSRTTWPKLHAHAPLFLVPFVSSQAHGLAFSVPKNVKTPPSLVNILKEVAANCGTEKPSHGLLSKWAEEGVLLLNTVLTVEAHKANSHKNRGWEKFTDQIIRAVNQQAQPIVFMLWGKPAQQKESMLNKSRHLILKSPHPSPLSGTTLELENQRSSSLSFTL